MDRNEFVGTLRCTLQGQMSDSQIEEHVNYYDHYISQELAKGMREEHVLEQLGDPRLIAKTIVNASVGQQQSKSTWTYTAEEEDAPKRFHTQENPEGGVDIHYGKLNLNTWYGKALVVLILVLVLILAFRIVGGILRFILPVLFPVLLVLLVIHLWKGKN